jgi:short-subunit dehydrogenase
MDTQLAGKRAVVTGGSQGIGKAVARAFASEGVAVAIGARTAETLRASADELRASGATVPSWWTPGRINRSGRSSPTST